MNFPVQNLFAAAATNLACDAPWGTKPVARQRQINGFLSHARQATVLALACVALSAFAQDKPWHNMGRNATPAEVKAWDIDVRPDFKGLPKGAGSVDQGATVWEAQCASCHGSFGESNEVFTPIIGGTTDDDIKTGRVQGLLEGKAIAPQRTTMMKVATVSTLWDYINRAMPWNAPKSLKPDEVFAVTAYLLNLANVVPADFTLSPRCSSACPTATVWRFTSRCGALMARATPRTWPA